MRHGVDRELADQRQILLAIDRDRVLAGVGHPDVAVGVIHAHAIDRVHRAIGGAGDLRRGDRLGHLQGLRVQLQQLRLGDRRTANRGGDEHRVAGGAIGRLVQAWHQLVGLGGELLLARQRQLRRDAQLQHGGRRRLAGADDHRVRARHGIGGDRQLGLEVAIGIDHQRLRVEHAVTAHQADLLARHEAAADDLGRAAGDNVLAARDHGALEGGAGGLVEHRLRGGGDRQ